MLRKTLFLFTFLVVYSTVHSQTQNRFATWFSSNNAIHLRGKWGLQFDMSIRSSDQLVYLQTILLRPGLSYRLNNSVTLLAGYNHVLSRNTIDNISGYLTEHQLWQQAFIRHRLFNRLNTLHRPLIEERFITSPYVSNNSIKTNGHPFVMRIRYLLRNVLPFKREAAFYRGSYAFAQQEILLNIGKVDRLNGKNFDQFRAAAGLGYRFSPKFDLEAGYLYRDIATRTSVHFHDHIVQIGSFLRL